MPSYRPQSGSAKQGRRSVRNLIAVVGFLTAFLLIATGCNDGGGADPSADSDGQVDSANAGDSDAGNTDPDGTDAGSANQEAARQQLETATSSCEVVDSLNALFSGGTPTNAEDAREFVDTYVTLVEKMAETTSDATLAESLRTVATNLRQFGEAVEYDPARLNLEGQPDYEGAVEDFAAVETWVRSEADNCLPDVQATP